MIRLVTRRRMRELTDHAHQARTRAQEVQGQADVAYAAHLRAQAALTERAVSAESDAAILREHVGELHEALTRVRAEASRLEGRSLMLLLCFGEPHSIHLTREDAYAYAATQGAPVNAWVTTAEVQTERVPWRCVPFTYDPATTGFRSVLAPAVRAVGGAG
ncbi:hypothetical protein [Streptomyces lavendulocolor]|uniref:hypothetical protein n=1 Tax=Streptomyces lavendulocolor TaxID=67316 RepID=UPI003C2EE318